MNLLPAQHVFDGDVGMMILFPFYCFFSILNGVLRAPVDAGEAHLTVLPPVDGCAVHSYIIFRAYPCAKTAPVTGIGYPELFRNFEDDAVAKHIAPSFEVLS